jgi:hypothetical protein
MSIFDFFSTVAGGGVVGSILHLGTSAFDVWRKGKETKLEIELMTARLVAAEKTEAWKAFAESQASGRALTAIPDGTPPAISAVYLLVDAFRNFTRPGLTWATMGFVVYVYATALPEQRAQLAPEVTFGAFTAFFWWFGERFQKRTSTK